MSKKTCLICHTKFFMMPKPCTSCRKKIKQRYILTLMCCCAVFNAYTMRLLLSITITEMVVHYNDTSRNNLADVCYYANETDRSLLYEWDEEIQGYILSSFYWGYCIVHIPGAIITEKFGGKHVLGVGIYLSAIMTFVTPWVIVQSGGNWVIVVVFRVAIGLCEGTTYPALSGILAQWVPPGERSMISSLVFSGSQLGTVVGILVGGALTAWTENWSTVFYLFGGLATIWYLVYQALCFSDPETHPFITQEEKTYIMESLAGHALPGNKHIPWCDILCSVPVWAMVVAEIGHDWAWFTLISELPKYMRDVLKFTIEENAIWSSLPFTTMWIMSLLSGYLCDWLINKKYLTTVGARKIFTAIGFVVPGLFMLLASYAECDRMLAVTYITLAVTLMAPVYSGLKANFFDISPNFAGSLTALINGFGVITGIITPYVVGTVASNRTITEWRKVFWITFYMLIFTSAVYSIFASGDVQSWNDACERRAKKKKSNKRRRQFRHPSFISE